MVVPEIHLRMIARWCAQRVPEHARGEVRVEHVVRGCAVTIVESRAPWREDAGSGWTRRPVAQLRCDGARWRLFWPDRDSRWHALPDVAAESSPAPLLEVIDEPGRAFW